MIFPDCNIDEVALRTGMVVALFMFGDSCWALGRLSAQRSLHSAGHAVHILAIGVAAVTRFSNVGNQQAERFLFLFSRVLLKLHPLFKF